VRSGTGPANPLRDETTCDREQRSDTCNDTLGRGELLTEQRAAGDRFHGKDDLADHRDRHDRQLQGRLQRVDKIILLPARCRVALIAMLPRVVLNKVEAEFFDLRLIVGGSDAVLAKDVADLELDADGEVGLAVAIGRERLRAHGLRGIAADMRLDLGDVVFRAEGRLDLIGERQCGRAGRNTACGSVVNRGRGGGASWGPLPLDAAHGVGQRALARRERRWPAVGLAEFLGH
jgi:hypothetical protein